MSYYGRARRYRCGGWSSWSGPCGATDCESCYPGGGGDDYPDLDDNPLWSRLSGAGYEPDDREYPQGTWSRRVRSRTHTCRRDHKDGRVKAGQRYCVTTYRNVDGETGKSWLVHTKCVLKD